MKTSALIIISLIILLFMFLKWQSLYNPFEGEIQKIELFTQTINGDRHNYLIEDVDEINQLQLKCKIRSSDLIASGSNDGLPFWVFNISYFQKENQRFNINENELNGRKHNNPKCIKYLVSNYG